MKTTRFFESRSKLFWMMLGTGLVIILGFIDLLTGYELSFSLFYLIPISTVTWFTSRRLGLVISTASTIAWFLADVLSGNVYSWPGIYLWNTLIRLGFFITVTALLAALRKSFDVNEELAHTDYVTGAASARDFYELVQTEIERSRRSKRPFTLAYIDMDDFKQVNDRFGHSAGDEVLRLLTKVSKQLIRGTDIFARLGGDEFALFLSEAGEAEAKAAIERFRENISREMQRAGWPVTVSIGVVTYNKAPERVDEIVKAADNLMYSIKSSGKNNVGYSLYSG